MPLPIFIVSAGVYLAKTAVGVAVEVAAKKLYEKLTESKKVTDRANTQCECGGFFMAPKEDSVVYQAGLVQCDKCDLKVARLVKDD